MRTEDADMVGYPERTSRDSGDPSEALLRTVIWIKRILHKQEDRGW
jgi:hypothetical protein